MTHIRNRSNRQNNTRFPFTGSLQYRMPLALHVAGKNCHLPSPSPVRNRADTTDCATPTHWDTVFGKIRFRNKSTHVFCTNKGKALKVNNYETNFKKYGERVGLSDIHPHMLRNNFAKRFLMQGGDIYTLSRILGHSSVKVTEEAYLDLDENDLRINYQRYSPLANLKRG